MKHLICLLVIVLGAWSALAQPRLVNGIAARVNEAVITYKDLENRLAPDVPYLEDLYRNKPQALAQRLDQLQQEALATLIEEQLILHEFKTAGYNLPESFVEEQINKSIREAGGRLVLTKTLQARGRTYESYRKLIRDNIIINEMIRHNVPPDPIISPYRLEKYYLENQDQFKVEDQVKLRMIVLTTNSTDTEDAPKKLAQEIIAKLDEGAPFDEMARIYSQGSQSAEGGDWGWIERSVLRADLAEKAFALKPGQRTGVIEAPDACYVMLVEGAQPAHVRSLAEVRDEIEATLKKDERERLRKQWIERLKDKSFVRLFPL